MKDLVQCRKLEAKFRQLAVSDPARRFLWLAEAEKWEREAEAAVRHQREKFRRQHAPRPQAAKRRMLEAKHHRSRLKQERRRTED